MMDREVPVWWAAQHGHILDLVVSEEITYTARCFCGWERGPGADYRQLAADWEGHVLTDTAKRALENR